VRKSADQTVTSYSDINSAGQTVYNSGSCSVTNAVTEVFYTITYQVTYSGVFTILGIQVDLVLADNLSFDPKFC
jgi:hypothetical protein